MGQAKTNLNQKILCGTRRITTSRNGGFTILEMLIVLSIISLIFTLTLPNIQSRLTIIRTKGCESLVDVINSNIIQYELEQGEIPQSMEDLLETGLIKEQQMKCPNGANIVIVDGQAEASQ